MARLCGAGGRPVPRYVIALLFTVAIGALVAWMVLTALGFGRSARTVPLVVGVPTLALIVAQLVRDGVRVIRGDRTVGAASEAERDRYLQAATAQGAGSPATAGSEAAGSEAARSEAAGSEAAQSGPADRPGGDRSTSMIGALLWVVSLALLIWLLGMLVAVPVFMVAFMSIFGRERWITVALSSAGTTVAVYLLFVVVLEVRIYPGQLGGLLPWP